MVIECLDWADFLPRYDAAETLFYLDPPYVGCERDYGPGLFARDDFAALAAQLRAIKGRFLLSINDVPAVRDLFVWARIDEVSASYTISREAHARGARAELLIRNFEG